ncbi:DUF636 domain-containing protein [Pholiota conissans]|uniref:DUF636 domain-containing protein n=1 Tax=Pholiota conissans TaxID=109636 RepID=A0A9P5Z2L7_9AGAR|nr:DUF636 domain-containing protein [Pholiota conissans]
MSTGKTYHGSCLCRATKFTLSGEPFHYTICHCKNCKHASGSAFLSHAIFKTSQFTITEGECLITHYADSDTQSGNTITRSFCSKCGSPLFLRPMKDGIILIHPGQIEEPVLWVPKKESYSHEKLPWLKEITIQQKKAKL